MIAKSRVAVEDETTLRRALAEGDIAPLLMVLSHLGGDDALLEACRPYTKGPWNFMEEVPAALKRQVHDALVAVLRDYAEGDRTVPPPLTDDGVARIQEVHAHGQPHDSGADPTDGLL